MIHIKFGVDLIVLKDKLKKYSLGDGSKRLFCSSWPDTRGPIFMNVGYMGHGAGRGLAKL